MSARCTAAVFERYPAGGGEFALALALADNAHDDGTHIFPSQPTMAHKSRQDVRTVQRHLKKMLASGWLLLVRPASGRSRPAEYRISPRWLKGDKVSSFPTGTPDPEKDDNLSPFQPEKGDTMPPFSAEKRATTEAEKGDIQNTAYRTGRTNTPLPPCRGDERVEETGDAKAGADALRHGFDSIAAGYPRRDGIDAAWRDWRNLNPDAELQQLIVRAIQAWIRSERWKADEGRWIPKLGKFLRDRRWLDAPGSVQPASAVVVSLPPVKLSAEQLQANARRAQEVRERLGLQRSQRKAVAA